METPPYNLPAALKWMAALVAVEWLRVPAPMRLLVGLIMLDYATGILAAFMRKEVSSRVGFEGLVKKILIIVILMVAHAMEKVSGIELKLESVGAAGFIVNECASIVENCAKCNMWIPAPIVEALLVVKSLRAKGASAEQLRLLRDEPAEPAPSIAPTGK